MTDSHLALWMDRKLSVVGLLRVMSCHGNVFRRVTVLLWRESTGHSWIPSTEWQVMRKLDHFHLINYNTLLSKRSRTQRFETPRRSCNAREKAALFISPRKFLFCRNFESHLCFISVITAQPGWQLLNKDKLNSSTLLRKTWKSKKIAHGKIDSGPYWPLRKMIWHISSDLLSRTTRWNGQSIITISVVC